MRYIYRGSNKIYIYIYITIYRDSNRVYIYIYIINPIRRVGIENNK